MEILQQAVVIVMVLLPLAGVLLPFLLADPARKSSGLSRTILKIMAVLPGAGTLVLALAVGALAAATDRLKLPLSWQLMWFSGGDFQLHLRFILDGFSLLAIAALSMVVLAVQISGVRGVDSVPLPFRSKPSFWTTLPVLVKPFRKWGRWHRWAEESRLLLKVPYSRSRVSLQNGLLLASVILVMGSSLIVSWLGLELGAFFTWLLLNSYMQDRAKSSAALRFFLMQRVFSLLILTSCVFVYEVVGGLSGLGAGTFMEMIVGAPAASLQVPLTDGFAGTWIGTGTFRHGQVKSILVWAAFLSTVGVAFTGSMATMRRCHFMGAGIGAGPLAAVHGAGVGVASLLWLLRAAPIWTGVPPFGPMAIACGLGLAFFGVVHYSGAVDLRQRLAIGTSCHLGLMIALIGWGQWESVIKYLIGFMLLTAGVMLALGRLLSGQNHSGGPGQGAQSPLLLQSPPGAGALTPQSGEYYLLALATPVSALLPVGALTMAGAEGPAGPFALYLAGLGEVVAPVVQWSVFGVICLVPLLIGWHSFSTWAMGARGPLTGREPGRLRKCSAGTPSGVPVPGGSLVIPSVMVCAAALVVVFGGGGWTLHPGALAGGLMPVAGLVLAGVVWARRGRLCRLPTGSGGAAREGVGELTISTGVKVEVEGQEEACVLEEQEGTLDEDLPQGGPLASMFVLPVYWLADMVINRVFEFLFLESVLFKLPIVVAEFLGKGVRWLTGGRMVKQIVVVLLAVGGLIALAVTLQ